MGQSSGPNDIKHLDELSDEELMLVYQDGNEKAFEVLYMRHSSKIYGYLTNSLKNRAYADDVFQATFLKLHQTRNNYDSSFPFVPWLFTICRSVMIDSIRKKERTKEDLNPVAVEEALAPESEEQVDLPDLKALPDTQRKAIELRYGSDLSFEEIARKLETSPTNVRQLISRAIKKLKIGGNKK